MPKVDALLTKAGQFKTSVIWVNSAGGKIWPSMPFTTLSSILHSQRGGYRWNVFASLKSHIAGASIAGKSPVTARFCCDRGRIGGACASCAVLLGSAPAHPETRVAFLFMAAASFLAAAVQMQRSSTRAERCRTIACRAQGRNPSCRRHRPSLAIGEWRSDVERKRSAISGDFFP